MSNTPAPFDNGGPAFPQSETALGNAMGVEYGEQYEGMSLRDYFAGQCDVLAYTPIETFERAYGRRPGVEELAGYIAEIRGYEADAMIAARNGGAK